MTGPADTTNYPPPEPERVERALGAMRARRAKLRRARIAAASGALVLLVGVAILAVGVSPTGTPRLRVAGPPSTTTGVAPTSTTAPATVSSSTTTSPPTSTAVPDGTQQIIRDYLQREGLPGEVFEAPWRDFAHNRSLALARLRDNESIDYAFVIDADDLFVPDLGFDPAAFKQNLSLGHYGVLVQDGPVTYYRPQICNNRRDYRYRGVVHEFLAAPPGCSGGTATGFHIASRREGARSRDPDKYRKDAQLSAGLSRRRSIRGALHLYLPAQSYRDAGQTAEAAEHLRNAPEWGLGEKRGIPPAGSAPPAASGDRAGF